MLAFDDFSDNRSKRRVVLNVKHIGWKNESEIRTQRRAVWAMHVRRLMWKWEVEWDLEEDECLEVSRCVCMCVFKLRETWAGSKCRGLYIGKGRYWRSRGEDVKTRQWGPWGGRRDYSYEEGAKHDHFNKRKAWESEFVSLSIDTWRTWSSFQRV